MELLFLAHRAPAAPDRGDRIRSWHILDHLSRRARVHLVALDEGGGVMTGPLAARLASCTVVRRDKGRARATLEALATGRPVSLSAFAHPAIGAAVTRLLHERPIDAAYVFSGQMAQYLHADGPPTIVDWVDVDSAKFGQMASSSALPLRPLLAREARLLGRFEREVAARVHANLFVSGAEADLFRAGGGRGRIAVVENGVDTTMFAPGAGEPQPLARPTIVFTGQMDYAPNAQAATWFAREVLPLVRRRHPDAAFAVVGRAPTAGVGALAGPDVIVTGEVADVRPWLAAAAVCAAPLHLARGIQNKVLEAMAMARPVVATAAAAEGIDHAGTLRTADRPDETAAAVVALLDRPDEAAALGGAAREQVVRRYGWAERLRPLDALIDRVSPAALAA